MRTAKTFIESDRLAAPAVDAARLLRMSRGQIWKLHTSRRPDLEAAAARLVWVVGWWGRKSRRWSQAAWLGRQLRELKTATGERLPDERIAAIVRQWDSSHDKPLSGRELMKALRGGRKRHALEPATPLEPMGGENVTGSFLLKGML
jgi:hypothetical protein